MPNLKPFNIFIIYAREDADALRELRVQFIPVARRENLNIWYDGEILPGQHWDAEIKGHLQGADIILLFISKHFFASDYIQTVELREALARHHEGKSVVIPVIVRHCLWQDAFDVSIFQALPEGAQPIYSSAWRDPDEAMLTVVEGVKRVIAGIRNNMPHPKDSTTRTLELFTDNEPGGNWEEQRWKQIRKLDIKEAYEVYIRENPKSIYVPDAAKRIRQKERFMFFFLLFSMIILSSTAYYIWRFTNQTINAQTNTDDVLPSLSDSLLQANSKDTVLLTKRTSAASKQTPGRKKQGIDRNPDVLHSGLGQGRKSGFEMVKVPGGSFIMGDDNSKSPAEKPAHRVQIAPFFIGRHEVTQADWLEIMQTPVSHFKCDQCPVEKVSWLEVQEFIQKLNEKTKNNYRLPTEAEWEFAARGGKSNGFIYAGSDELDLVAWHDGNSSGKTHPVGSKNPNRLGLYDMSGNVCEWCQDKWHDSYSGAPTAGFAWTQSPSIDGRVFRGGCWNNHFLDCGITARYWDYAHSKFNNVGFRLAHE
ncbi:MAG: SUMF1/EgtB/PvdO family nonheme iron enzyme [Lewinellaceae bacterium]|nr:SUMF1/EgtB/PvdO family nonheme iron enzyme [Lewinellaceae bacterium]